jgi:hypothetical protein
MYKPEGEQKMIEKPSHKKYYSSSKDRFLRKILIDFFAKELTKMFGPMLREKVVDEIIDIVNSVKIPTEHLEPGQTLWYAIDKETRADSKDRKYKPVILTMINNDDCNKLSNGIKMSTIASEAIARIMNESYSQGALLSMRDIELLTWRGRGGLVNFRHKYESTHKTVLPFTGTLQDMGSCITHKNVIVKKVILEKKDPRYVAKETNHSQKAVDHYVKDYHRVRQVYEKEGSPDYISQVTGIAKHVVNQYIEIIKQENN